jgi:hypothetical protein
MLMYSAIFPARPGTVEPKAIAFRWRRMTSRFPMPRWGGGDLAGDHLGRLVEEVSVVWGAPGIAENDADSGAAPGASSALGVVVGPRRDVAQDDGVEPAHGPAPLFIPRAPLFHSRARAESWPEVAASPGRPTWRTSAGFGLWGGDCLDIALLRKRRLSQLQLAAGVADWVGLERSAQSCQRMSGDHS